MALLQILLDRSFVLLGLLRCGGGRVEFFEHFRVRAFRDTAARVSDQRSETVRECPPGLFVWEVLDSPV